MKKIHQRVTQITILPEGEPIFSTQAIVVSIGDEAEGEYVTIKTQYEAAVMDQEITIDPVMWPHTKEAIDRMMDEISEWEEIATDTKE